MCTCVRVCGETCAGTTTHCTSPGERLPSRGSACHIALNVIGSSLKDAYSIVIISLTASITMSGVGSRAVFLAGLSDFVDFEGCFVIYRSDGKPVRAQGTEREIGTTETCNGRWERSRKTRLTVIYISPLSYIIMG